MSSGRLIPALVLLASCATPVETPDLNGATFETPAIPMRPRTYTAPRARTAPVIDGRLDDRCWQDAAWTDDFVDISGPGHPTPRHRTRAKIAWDDTHLYVAAEMEEPHLWATYTERDSIIFHENDIEMFVDPDGDTHDYFELEVNVLGTEWDLYLTRPYRDDGTALHDWDARGLRSAVHARGTINDSRDVDDGWSIEIAWPFASFAQGAGTRCPPQAGDRWRMNFSRVQWHTVGAGGYTKLLDAETSEPLPEDNWVWSPQGLVAMHYPEMWGVVEFMDAPAPAPTLLPADGVRAALFDVYYRQRRFHEVHGRYARLPLELGLANPPTGLSFQVTRSGWEARAPVEGRTELVIRESGRIRQVSGEADPAMNMAAIDWAIFIAVYIGLFAGVQITKRHMRSVADFLAAGRTAGRYLLSVAAGMAGLGAITVVANFEMNHEAGFTMAWWGQSMGLVILAVTASGWVIYRFRQTRCLTLPEFFERRYSRRFRVFAGVVAYVAGLINFGIFPAVGARFFMVYMGVPDTFAVAGFDVPTFPLGMAVLLGTALYFVYAGGQVAVMVTDFLQGLLANIVFVIVPFYLVAVIGWDRAVEAFVARPEGRSFLDAFDTANIPDFNFWYFLIGVVGFMYTRLAWQGEQAYNTSAKSAHEAKMGGMLSGWRGIPQGLLLTLVPALCYAALHHADFADLAASVNSTLDARSAVGADAQQVETLRNQMRIPVTLAALLPPGLLGAFAAVMLGLFVSTHDTYLHSWGSMFVQDVLLPFRKTKFTKDEHLRVLRRSVFGVAVFIFLFSWLVGQTQHIMLYFAVTGAIFAGGSGAVIIGGLYWRRGTAMGAWLALAGGAIVAVSGVLVPYFADVRWLDPLRWNGQEYWALSMGTACVLYVVGSLLDPRPPPDLDRVLKRGAHVVAGERVIEDADMARGWRVLGLTPEFSRRDKILYGLTYAWTFLWIAAFVVGSVASLSFGKSVDTATWATYWKWYFMIQGGVSVAVILWFTVGGLRDMAEMFRRLGSMQRDDSDDGQVHDDAR